MEAWDETLLLSMGSDREWLRKRVVDVNTWLRNLSSTGVLLSAQIPFWLKIGREKAVYKKSELRSNRREMSRGEEMHARWTQKGVTEPGEA